MDKKVPSGTSSTDTTNSQETPRRSPTAARTAGGGGGGRREPRFTLKATGDAAKTYDFLAARPSGKRTTVLEGSAHLIKSCLGGGVVGIHEAYKQCGLLTSVVLNVILGYCVSYCMYLLATAAQKAYGRVQVPYMSYPDLAEASLDICPFPKLQRFSRCFRYMVDFTIMIDLFGSCCCYQVIIARSIKQLVENVDEVKNEGNPPIRVYIACLLIPCILLCWIRTLKYLAPFSIVADVFIVVVAVATVVYGSMNADKTPLEVPIFKTIPGLFEFLGVCVFSMEGVGATLAIENSLQHPRKMPQVLTMGMVIVVSIVISVGFFGYWGFGEKSRAPVTVNFPRSILTTVLRVAMALMIYVTFGLNFWVPFDLAWYYLSKRYSPDRYWLVERAWRTLFVIIITLISITFPDVSKFMGVLGAFCLSNMGFIWPAFIELMLEWHDPGLGCMKWRLVRFIIILIFGVTLAVVGTYSNVKELILEVYGNKKE